jgi:hypothetical protein
MKDEKRQCTVTWAGVRSCVGKDGSQDQRSMRHGAFLFHQASTEAHLLSTWALVPSEQPWPTTLLLLLVVSNAFRTYFDEMEMWSRMMRYVIVFLV